MTAHLEHVRPPDHVINLAEAHGRHVLPRLLCHHEKVINHVLGLPRKLLAENRVLGRDPHGARVLVTLPHHDAPDRHQGGGAEPVLLGPQKRSNSDVAARLELPISLEHGAPAQVVCDQGLVGFREAELPGEARVLDASPTGGARAAIVARDEDMICGGRDDFLRLVVRLALRVSLRFFYRRQGASAATVEMSTWSVG